MPCLPLLPNYPVTDFIPRNSINILCGPPYSGKDKLLQTAIRNYTDHGEWLGSTAPLFPEMDDPLPMTARVGAISATGLPLPATIPQVQWKDFHRKNDERPMTIERLFELFAEPRPQLLVVDGFQKLMPGGKINDYCEVAHWGSYLHGWCRSQDVTMIGTAPASKTREEDGGYAPHDRVLGSVGWAQLAYTLWLIDLVDRRNNEEAARSTQRLLITLTHGPHPTSWVYYDLDSNDWLVPSLTSPHACDAAWREGLAEMVAANSQNPLRTSQIVELAATLGISKPTVERWLHDMWDEGRILKIRKGMYSWVDKPKETC